MEKEQRGKGKRIPGTKIHDDYHQTWSLCHTPYALAYNSDCRSACSGDYDEVATEDDVNVDYDGICLVPSISFVYWERHIQQVV